MTFTLIEKVRSGPGLTLRLGGFRGQKVGGRDAGADALEMGSLTVRGERA